MKRIAASSLQDGQRLSDSLFNMRGIKLLPGGTVLNPALIDRLTALWSEFHMASGAEAFIKDGVLTAVDLDRFKHKAAPPRMILTAGCRPLSQVADRLEHHHLEALQFGAFALAEPEPRAEAQARYELDQEALAQKQEAWAELSRNIPHDPVVVDEESDSDSDSEPPQETDDDSPRKEAWPTPEELAQWRDEQAARIHHQYARMLAWLPAEAGVFAGVVDDLMMLLRTDRRRFAQIALLCPRTSNYIPHHAIGAAVLAVSMAARKGWREEDIRLAGMSALVHDVGMLMLPQRIRTQPGALCDVDRSRVIVHPVDSALMVLNSPDIPDVVAMAAYRHHERDNGHGYPLGLLGSRIGQLPRLLAVADSASALNEPRPYRPDVLPHTAVMEIAEQAGEGFLFRPMVRALVESIGLYPIGSYVLLSDERIARVVGIRHDSVDQPIVEICTAQGQPSGEVIDLTEVEPWELSALDGCANPALECAA
ncbi:MAG: HD domain-containing protein [Planctomycetes bacterium]|nr:HD domain-containing protein [Planctomycetota bacterium]NOG54873.1 HD domain-containing protein [Planctomycetota bacterium]